MPQTADAQCPSKNPLGIQCTCVDSGIAKKLIPSYGPNLVLTPAGLLSHWLHHARNYLDTKAQGCKWVVRQAYGDAKLKTLAKKLDQHDRDLIRKSQRRPYFSIQHDRSNVICFSTSGSYSGQMDKVMADYTPRQAKRGKAAPVSEKWTWWDIGWGRVLVDEVHVEHNETAGTINRVRTLNRAMEPECPRKILISGTPFESSPAHMAAWIGVIQDERWLNPPRVSGYRRMRTQQGNLHLCTKDALIELGKRHDQLVKMLRNGEAKNCGQRLKEHERSITTVVQTLWLRRTAESTFMGFDLVRIPPNFHYDCLLPYPERYHHILDDLFDQITKEIQEVYDRQLYLFNAKQKAVKPVIAVHTWLMAARRARILSSFPELAIHEATKGLALTLKEAQEERWIQVEAGKLYQLAQTGSPYEKAIHDIAGNANCMKLRTLQLVREHIWGKHEKVVIMAMGPVSALIIYWVSLESL